MVNQRKEESTHHNGVEKGAYVRTRSLGSALNNMSTEARGYLSLAGGLFLLVISLVYPAILSWIVALAGIGLGVYGARATHLWQKTKNLINSLKEAFSKSSHKKY